MKMIDMALRMEVIAGDIFSELHKNFVEQLTDEDFVTDFLIEVGSNPERYSDILDPKIVRIALAYKAAMDCFMELDELAAFEQFMKPEEEPTEPKAPHGKPQNHQKILEFPNDVFGISEEDTDDG